MFINSIWRLYVILRMCVCISCIFFWPRIRMVERVYVWKLMLLKVRWRFRYDPSAAFWQEWSEAWDAASKDALTTVLAAVEMAHRHKYGISKMRSNISPP